MYNFVAKKMSNHGIKIVNWLYYVLMLNFLLDIENDLQSSARVAVVYPFSMKYLFKFLSNTSFL